jgi:hypothetical protein
MEGNSVVLQFWEIQRSLTCVLSSDARCIALPTYQKKIITSPQNKQLNIPSPLQARENTDDTPAGSS